ncbi:MAG: acyltransferase family protein [Chthoniobacterales bacterium]
MPPPKDRVFGLDFLRAAAILSVVATHALSVLFPYLVHVLGVFGHGGFYGVELFFVLSGFLIGRILIRQGEAFGKPDRLAEFYVRRWFRTLPLFLLFLVINIWVEHHFRNHTVGVAEALSHALFLRNLTGLHISFFLESWSLAVEEWFYLLFPALLWVGLKLSKRFDAVFITAASAFFTFSIAARMVAAVDPAAHWSDALRMVVIFRFDALMIGMFAAWLSLRFPAVWRSSRWNSMAIGVILLASMYATLWKIENGALAFGDDSYFARTLRFSLVSFGFALLLPWGSGWEMPVETWWSRAIRKVALWSYALYLAHLPMFLIVERVLSRQPTGSLSKALLIYMLDVCGAVVVSAVLYHFFEARCTRLREKAVPIIRALSLSSRSRLPLH